MYTHAPEGYHCIFCAYVAGEETERNTKEDVVFESKEVLAFVSPRWWPNNPGNALVIPRAHFENLYDIPEEVLAATHGIAKKVALAMKRAYGCEGISIHQHNEHAGDQEIWHYHIHVYPRWEGDELYINHHNSRYVPIEERRPYADKLRSELQA